MMTPSERTAAIAIGPDEARPTSRAPETPAAPMGFRPTAAMWFYLAAVVVMYASALAYAAANGLSIAALFEYGLLQPTGITGEEARLVEIDTPFNIIGPCACDGEEARLVEIDTPLSWNIPQVVWYVYIKGAAVLVELFQYWVVGMLIAAALGVFVSWEKVRAKMGFGGFKANLLAATAGAVIPICSCGIVPVLAGMVEAGIPLGPTMAFLIAAPMLNVPTVFMTAGVLGWPMAVARVVATFGIALAVGAVLSRWQKKHRNPRHFLKIHIPPRLTPEMQRWAFQFGILATNQPQGIRPEQLGPDGEKKLALLEEAGLAERTRDGLWKLPPAENTRLKNVGACGILPQGGSPGGSLAERIAEMFRMALRLFIQLNGYLVLAVLIAGAIKVLLPTRLITEWVGGTALNSVLVTAAVAVLAYVCTYVEVPTALALMSKGMGPGSTLAYLLGGPGLSLPSIAMLAGVFRPKVLVLYVGVSFVGCVLAGYVYNLFF